MSNDQSVASILYDKAQAIMIRWREINGREGLPWVFHPLNPDMADFIETMNSVQPRWDEVGDWPDVFEAAHRELIRRW